MMNRKVTIRNKKPKITDMTEDQLNEKISTYLEEILNTDKFSNFITKEELKESFAEQFVEIKNVMAARIKHKVDRDDLLSLEDDLTETIKRQNEIIFGGMDSTNVSIENPKEFLDLIQGNFYLKYIGFGLYKICGKITIMPNSRINDKMLNFNFPLNVNVQNSSTFIAMREASKHLDVITVYVEQNSFHFRFVKMSSDKEHIISLEHILNMQSSIKEADFLQSTN